MVKLSIGNMPGGLVFIETLCFMNKILLNSVSGMGSESLGVVGVCPQNCVLGQKVGMSQEWCFAWLDTICKF